MEEKNYHYDDTWEVFISIFLHIVGGIIIAVLVDFGIEYGSMPIKIISGTVGLIALIYFVYRYIKFRYFD
jgi:hypothetical protein